MTSSSDHKSEYSEEAVDINLLKIFEGLGYHCVQTDNEHRILRISGSLSRILGYSSPENLVGRHISKLYADSANHQNIIEQIDNNGQVRDISVDLCGKRGITINARANFSYITSEENGVIGMIGAFADVANQKTAEEYQRSGFSGNLNSAFVEMIPHVVLRLDTDGRIRFINHVGFEMTGYSEAELYRLTHFSSLFSQKSGSRMKDFTQIINNGGFYEYIGAEILGKDGRTVPVNLYGLPIIQNKLQVGYWIIAVDVSHQKRMEKMMRVIYDISEAVSTSENLHSLYAFIHRRLNDLICSKNFFIALVNPESDSLELPYHVDEKDRFTTFPAGKTFTRYVLDTEKPLLATEKVITDLLESGQVELVCHRPKVWLGVPLRIEGKIIGVVAVQHYEDPLAYSEQDVNILGMVSDHIAAAIQRKQIRDELRFSEEKYRTLVEGATELILNIDRDGIILYVNSRAADFIGLPAKGIINNSIYEFMPISEADTRLHNLRDAIDNNKRCTRELEMNIRGRNCWFKASVSPIVNEQGTASALVIASDITRQKNSEIESLESRRRYQTLINSSPDGILVVEKQSKKAIFVNPAFIRLTGFSEEELLERRVGDLSPPKSRKKAIHEFERLYTGKSEVAQEMPLIRKDGSIIYVSIRAVPEVFDNRDVVIGFFRDITEIRNNRLLVQKQSRELRKLSGRLIESHENLYRDIAREMHDSVIQMLGTAKVNLENEILELNGVDTARIKNVSSLISETATEMRNISTGLRPRILDEEGLLPAIKWIVKQQCPQMRTSYSISGTSYELDKYREINVFRIFQEIINNIGKHSRATRIDIKINYTPECLQCTVNDNGIGFKTGESETGGKDYRSFGLINMQERVELMNGEIDICSNEDRGTTIKILIPTTGEEGCK